MTSTCITRVVNWIEINPFCYSMNINNILFSCVGFKFSCEVLDPVLVYIEGLHRLSNCWNYTEYLVAAQIFHGTRPFGNPVLSKIAQPCMSFHKKLTFDCWLVIFVCGILFIFLSNKSLNQYRNIYHELDIRKKTNHNVIH